MEPSGPFPTAPARDPEFSPLTEYRESLPAGIEPESYLRILANPFLAFAGFVGWLEVTGWILRLFRQNPDLIGPIAPLVTVLLIVALFWLVPQFLQFHCLDCGRTGRLQRWRSHVCTSSNVRRLNGHRRWLRGPTPFFQNILWLWGLLTLLWFLHQAGFRWPGSGG